MHRQQALTLMRLSLHLAAAGIFNLEDIRYRPFKSMLALLLISDFFLDLDAPQAHLCINFLLLSLTWGLLSNIFVLFDLFSPACGLLSEF